MVAFGMSSPPAVLDLDGQVLRGEFDKDPGWFVENMEDQCLEQGLQGIRVWEGEPDVTMKQDDEGADLGGCSLGGGTWREPTDAEWVALRGCRSPFNSARLALGSLVE